MNSKEEVKISFMHPREQDYAAVKLVGNIHYLERSIWHDTWSHNRSGKSGIVWDC